MGKYIPIKSELLNQYVHHMAIDQFESGGENFVPVIPDGMSALVINTGASYHRESTKTGGLKEIKGSHVIGLKTGLSLVKTNLKMKTICIRFKPGAIRYFVTCPLNQLLDEVLDAELIFGKVINQLEEEIDAAKNELQVYQAIEKFLLKQYHENKDADRVIAKIRTIYRNPSDTKLSDLNGCSISYKQEERLFQKHLGVNPKHFIRMVRFNYATTLLSASGHGSLTEIAYRAGYYDQAHFIKSFKAFSGMCPKKYLGIDAPMLKANNEIIKSQFSA